MKNFIRGIALFLLLFSCSPPAVRTSMLMPAQYHEASQLKDVAVLPFEGREWIYTGKLINC